MNYEQRQYWLLRLVSIGFAIMVMGGLLATVILYAQIELSNHHFANSGCGCQSLIMPLTPWQQLIALTTGALTALIFIRFGYFGWHQLWRHNRIHRQLYRQAKQIYHHHAGLTYWLVDQDYPQALTLGLISPRIFLTRGLIHHLSASEITVVLRHERVHQQRRDPLMILILEIIGATFWWWPWLRSWVAASHSLRELTADAQATNNYHSIDPLGQAMLKLATVTTNPRLAAFSPNADRVEKLLDQSWRRPRHWNRWSMAAAVLVLAVVGFFYQVRATTAALQLPARTAICRETRLYCPWNKPPENPFSRSMSAYGFTLTPR